MGERLHTFLPEEIRRQAVRMAWGAAWLVPALYVGFWLRDRYGLWDDVPILVVLIWVVIVQAGTYVWQKVKGRMK